MAKKRKMAGRSRPKRELTMDEQVERMPDPNPKSRSYMFDEIDEFHESQQKVLLQSAKKYESHVVESDEEEAFGLNLSSADEDEGMEKYREFQMHHKKEQMDSDLEDQDEDDLVPDDKAWGRYKPAYYNTDYVDKGRRDKTEAESELAEAEEQEAKALQQRLAKQLDDQDFDLDQFTVAKRDLETKEVKKQVVEKDLSKLSKQEKIEIVKRESPELLVLLEDLKKMINETKERLLPLMSLIERGIIPDGPAATYLKTKFRVLTNYFTNACFYVMLKAKRAPLLGHTIVSRLVGYRKMIQELCTFDELLQGEVNAILKCVKQGGDIDKLLVRLGHKGQPKQSSQKQLGILKNNVTPDAEVKEKRVSFLSEWQKRKGAELLTNINTKLVADDKPAKRNKIAVKSKTAAIDETLGNNASPLRKKVKIQVTEKNSDSEDSLGDEECRMPASAKKSVPAVTASTLKAMGDEIHLARLKAGERMKAAKSNLAAKVVVSEAKDDENQSDDVIVAEDKNTEKRAITFQISKNKGLTPYRKKEDANPRVKYRKKFKKAVIRRKGQVREIRREDTRYGGETSGIRASTSRSVKFK